MSLIIFFFFFCPIFYLLAINYMLHSLQITEKVESLCIPKYYYFEDDFVNYSNIFKRMQSLKVLIVSDGTFSLNCAITYLPSSLRFIAWEGYPSISLPESFEPWQLVMLVLSKSLLVELCPISKVTHSYNVLFELNKLLIKDRSRNFVFLVNKSTVKHGIYLFL